MSSETYRPRAAGRRALLLVLLIIALGAGLRLYGLTHQSLWNDELSSYVRSHFDQVAAVIDEGARYDGHPPGYLLLMFVVQKFFGHSEATLRLPSALAGILALWVIYLLGRRLYAWQEGAIAAGLMAVSWAPVYYSQEARPYAFVILLALLTVYLWLPFLPLPGDRARGSTWQTAGYILAALATAYMHYFGLLLVALQGVTALIFALHGRRGIRRVLVTYAAILLGYLPWLAFVSAQLGMQFSAPLPPPSPGIFVDFFRHVFYGPRYVAGLALGLYGLALAVVIYRMARQRRPWREALADSWAGVLLVAWLIVPIAIAFVESRLLLPIVQLRYLLICLPPAYLLLARAITTVPLHGWGRPALAIAVIACYLGVLLGPLHYYSRLNKEQFREAVTYVAEQDAAHPDSLIVGNVWHPDYLNYYFEQVGSARRTDLIASHPEDLPALVGALETRRPRYVWFIAAHLTPDPQVLGYLESHLTPLDHRQLLEADVWLFESKGIQ
jgi:mannosyltransferase